MTSPEGVGIRKMLSFFFRIAADELVRLAYRDAFADPRHGLEDAEVDGAFVAGDADGRSNRAGDRVRFEAEAFDALADFADLLLGGVRLHDDKHGMLPSAVSEFSVYGKLAGAANTDELGSWRRLDSD